MGKQKSVEPIPEEFESYEKAAEFWDTHDTTDYPKAFSDVSVGVDLKGRRFEIAIDEDVMLLLRAKAKKAHARPGPLASRLLRKELTAS